MEYITKFAPDVFEAIASPDRIDMPPPPWDPNGIQVAPAISVQPVVSNGGRSTSADKAAANIALLTQPSDATSGACAEVEPDVVHWPTTLPNVPFATHKPVSQTRQESANFDWSNA
ncbi:hypothetical protein PHLCEN_2v10436 [Hermanssonia centrifuga]|uniref:Uncharacterized protein n=1 Tax=Hermanssonia centrifuga TaxID=98765 RepID=A0A2R6NNV0_9APHY|nr:hypothetical protein PHLCEN_2v10436 [Hermanssonia centrifuga]